MRCPQRRPEHNPLVQPTEPPALAPTEHDRWLKALSPRLEAHFEHCARRAACCDYGCNQGRNCPARAARLAKPASSVCSDDTKDLHDDTGLLICQGIALLLVVTSLSAALYLLL